jgi:uncharacterized protein YkwD
MVLIAAGCVRLPAPARVSSRAAVETAAESAIVARVNHVRAAHGLAKLRVSTMLLTKARLWSRWMQHGGCGVNSAGAPMICHSPLTNGITVRWRVLAENVGRASPRSTYMAIERGFERSPTHLANILNPRVRYIGVGIACSRTVAYLTEEFMAT